MGLSDFLACHVWVHKARGREGEGINPPSKSLLPDTLNNSAYDRICRVSDSGGVGGWSMGAGWWVVVLSITELCGSGSWSASRECSRNIVKSC